MGDIEKRLNKSAFKKASEWGTEVDVNVAGTGILALNPGVPQQKFNLIPEESAASPFETDLNLGDYPAADFALDCDGRFGTALWVPAAMVMGTAGTPTQQGSTAAWLHKLQMANTIATIFGTYATEKKDKIHIVPGVKPYGLKFSVKGGVVAVQVKCRGSHVVDTSTVITAMSSVTYEDKHNRIFFRQGVFRMNAQGGAALGDGDKIKIKDFDLEINRKPDAVNQTGQRFIAEPLETDKPEVKLTINMNRLDDTNKAYFADWLAESEKKADLKFTGALIADTYYYYLHFQFPRLVFEDVEYADNPVIPAKVVLRAVEADTAPTGMTGITKPVQIDLMNKRTTDLLA